jgi:hypothetical protein
VGTDLGTEPVLQRGDDPAPVGVVLRVRTGDQEQVERQPQAVAPHLDVALLEHVEHGDLDPLREVGQLVDPEDAAVRAGDQAVVHRLRIPQGAALRHLDRVHVADQVTDAGVGRGQLLDVPQVPVQPADRQLVAELTGEPATTRADRRGGVVVDLAPFDHRGPLVQQRHQRAHQPCLALPALTEQDQVVTGKQGALELRQHGVVEPDDPGEGRLPGAQSGEQVLAELLLDRAGAVSLLTEGSERRGLRHPESLGRTSRAWHARGCTATSPVQEDA